MTRMAGQRYRWGRGFAEVMHERGEAYVDVRAKPRCLIENHECVNAAVDFRMPFPGLRDAEQGINFREDRGERTAMSQYFEVPARCWTSQRLLGFLPDPMRD